MSLAADGLPPLREVVAAHGLTARKALGQNFLFDLNLTRKIARAAGPLAGVVVVEVGPGPGGLTRALLSEGAEKVIAIERDFARARRACRNWRALAGTAGCHRWRRASHRGSDAHRQGAGRVDPHRRQLALQRRNRTLDPMARGRALATVL